MFENKGEGFIPRRIAFILPGLLITMEFEMRVTTEEPNVVLERVRSHSEFDEVSAEQDEADSAFASPGAVEIVVDFLSDPGSIALLYSLIRDLGYVLISVRLEEDITPKEFILENTNTKEEHLELVRQEPQGHLAEYKYRDSSRGVRYTVRIPDSGEPEFEMRQEEK